MNFLEQEFNRIFNPPPPPKPKPRRDRFEYATVMRETKNKARLRRLSRFFIGQDDARAFLDAAAENFKWSRKPTLSFTGRSHRGTYHWDDERIVIRPRNISAELFIHELAHHWHVMDHGVPKAKRDYHGNLFVYRLDHLAEFMEREYEVS